MRSAETVLGIIRLRRTLESRVLRKAHARFGEGRMEKCSRSNSPAAYSTLWSVASTRRTPSASGRPCVSGYRSSRCRFIVRMRRGPRRRSNKTGSVRG
jgi:hypothetical protein